LNIVGAGSGLYSASLGQYYFALLANKYARVHASDEFLNLVHFTATDHLIALSQSGETFDTLEVVYDALNKGVPVTGVNNVFGSTCHRIVNYPVFQGAGAEVCVLSTKSVISQDMILYLLAAHMGHKNGTLTTETFKTLLDDARRLPSVILSVLDNYQAPIREIAFAHKHIHNWFFIGREMFYAVALESALKYKEVSYIHAEAMSGGLFKHGTISLIDEEFHTIAFLPQQATSPHIFNFTLSNIAEIQARKGKVIAFCHEGDADRVSNINEYVMLPSVNRYLDPIIQLVAGQILAYYCGIALERNIDKPRSLAKSVTVR
jgi:glucosamine--fructose-6-phosphate aminotransferase (isomerizing)